jgi:hypothetical protein
MEVGYPVFRIGQGSSKGQSTCTPDGFVRLPGDCKVKMNELPVHDWFGFAIGSQDSGSSGKAS